MDGQVEGAARGVDGGVSAAVLTPTWSWAGSAGLADTETARAITPETQFAVGSITKTFVAAMVLRLVDEGLVGLDDPVADHLPGDLGIDLNGATVADVLGHRSGIGEHTNDAFFTQVLADPDRAWTPRAALAFTEPAQFDAGSRFSYTNTNYVLAGLLIEKVTGSPLTSALRTEILSPAGLDHVELQIDDAPSGPVAVGLTDLDRAGTRESLQGDGYVPTRALATAAGAAGGIAADARSIAAWGRALYGGDVLSAASLAAMTTDTDPGARYGLGTEIVALRDDIDGYGHSGGIPGFTSAFVTIPDEGVTVAVLMNTDLVGTIRDPMEVARLFAEPILAGSPDAC
jgi:D-alanyl-D-alanine carboxypeptidase